MTDGPIAVDPAGNVFVRRNSPDLGEIEEAPHLIQFNPAGNQTAEFGRELPAGGIDGLGTNAIGDLYDVSGSAGLITVCLSLSRM